MKYLILPLTFQLSWLGGLFIFIHKVCTYRGSEPLPNEIAWDEFLFRLRPMDTQNVESLVARLGSVNEKIPLAVVAFGSALTNLRSYYGDIDLLLLPLHRHNISLAEVVFAEFARIQPETEKKEASPDKPVEVLESVGVYNGKRSWSLDFGQGTTPLHLMIRDGGSNPGVIGARVTLVDFLRQEPSARVDRPFSKLVLGSQES